MNLALALTTLGLTASYLLRQFSGRAPTQIVVAAHLSGLLLAWVGIINLVVGSAGLAHGLVEFCELAIADPPGAGGFPAVYVMAVVLVILTGRAAGMWWRTVSILRRTRRRLLRDTTYARDDVNFTALGSVACTVGLVRPQIFVDRDMFRRLTGPQQDAVIAHERVHVRGLHGVIDLVARCLAAGLAPWPGAVIAYREIRSHLEAMADDRAATHTTRWTVATAIVEAAAAPPRSALGAGGWSAWRVERLLDPAPPHHLMASAATVLVLLSSVVLVQTIGHVFAGSHFFPVAFPAI